MAQSLFPAAPEEVRDIACSYRWTSDGGASPDVGALRSLNAEHLTEDCSSAPKCALPSAACGEVAIVPPKFPTGVVGCDVCGRLRGRDLFVVLPPERMGVGTFLVPLTTGNFAFFELTPPRSGAQSFVVKLPPLAEGAEYQAGRVGIW